MPHKKIDERKIRILSMIKAGLYPTKISKILKISVVAVTKRIKKMEKENLIIKTNKYPAFYNLTAFGIRDINQSALSESKVNITSILYNKSISYHDFKVKIPILKKGSIPKKGKRIQLNGWVKEIHKIELPVKLTLELTNKNAILHYHNKELPRDTRFFQELFKWYVTGTESAKYYLRQYGYQIDIFNAQVISQHIATKTGKDIDDNVPNSTTLSVDLNRKAKAVTGNMQQQARAWLDKSEKIAEVETNDITYQEKLILLPETVTDIDKKIDNFHNSLELYNKNIELHLEVLTEMKKTLKKIHKEGKNAGK